MAGHSKWKQIKHRKATTDKGRGQIFSKLANLIALSAKEGSDPQFNPGLRRVIEQAKKSQMPQANILRAIKRAAEKGDLESLLVEAYGPEGIGILIEAVTPNRNRTINELRSLFRDYGAKLAPPGSLIWAFEKTSDGYRSKLQPVTSSATKEKFFALVQKLREREDIQRVYLTIGD